MQAMRATFDHEGVADDTFLTWGEKSGARLLCIVVNPNEVLSLGIPDPVTLHIQLQNIYRRPIII